MLVSAPAQEHRSRDKALVAPLSISMRLIIRLDPNQLRQWHLRLVQRLAQRPLTRIAVEWGGAAAPLPRAAIVMAAIECLIYRVPGTKQFARLSAGGFRAVYVARRWRPRRRRLRSLRRRPSPGRTDLAPVLRWPPRGNRRHRRPGPVADPVVSIVDASTGSEIVSGHPGVQSSRVLARAFDDVMARTATLVKAALDGAAPRYRGERPAPAPPVRRRPPGSGSNRRRFRPSLISIGCSTTRRIGASATVLCAAAMWSTCAPIRSAAGACWRITACASIPIRFRSRRMGDVSVSRRPRAPPQPRRHLGG